MKKKDSLIGMKEVVEKLRKKVKKLARIGLRLQKKEKELDEIKETLEKRVNVRTAAERIIHRQLHGEIKHYEQLEQSLEIALEYANGIINTMREPFIVLDEGLKVISANPSFYQTFKVTPENTEDQRIYNLGDGQWNIPKLRELLEDIIPNVTSFDNFEVSHVFPGIGKKVMLLNARKILGKKNQKQLVLLDIEDITLRKEAENKLHDLALQDELTKCVNFRSIMNIIESEINRSKRYKKEFSIIMMDMDYFKSINDMYGHLVGNDVLVAFANGVKRSIRNTDILGRYGGDEFIVIFPEMNFSQASITFEKIRKCLSEKKIRVRQGREIKKIDLQFSAGIAVFPSDANTAKALIDKADKDLYNRKKQKQVTDVMTT